MMAVFMFILGIIAFLLMAHPIAFWAVFVPLALIFVASLLGFFKNRRWGFGHFATALIVYVAMIVVLVIVCIP